MAKRYTDTEKWKKDWFCSLRPVHKVFWQYLTDNCSHAGIWEVNWKLAGFSVGARLDPAEIYTVFQKQFVPLDDGRRWFLVDFISFQHGPRLNPDNPAHKNIIPILQGYGLLNSKYEPISPKIEGASEGLPWGLKAPLVMVKAMAMVMDTQGGVGGFDEIWKRYPHRVGRKLALKHYGASVKTPDDRAAINRALDHYLASGNVGRGFIKNGSTWFNEWQDWVDPTETMMKGNANGHSKTQPGSQISRATFEHGPAELQRLRDFKESLDERDRERDQRLGSG